MTDNPRGAHEEAPPTTSPPGKGASSASPADRPDLERLTSPRTLRPSIATEEAAPLPPVESEPAAEAAPDTAAAEETEKAGRPGIDSVGALAARPLDPVAPSPRPGRPSGPVLAGAAIAGLLLVAAPFTVSAGTQGVSLDIVPLSNGSLLGGDPANGSGPVELETAPLGSSPASSVLPPVTGGADSDTDRRADEGGGTGGSEDPDAPGYVPEALPDEEPDTFPTGESSADSGTSGGGPSISLPGKNHVRYGVQPGDGTNIAGSQDPDPRDNTPPSAAGAPDRDDRGGRADSGDKPKSDDKADTAEDSAGDGLPLPGDRDTDDKQEEEAEEQTAGSRTGDERPAAEEQRAEDTAEEPSGESRPAAEASEEQQAETPAQPYTAVAGPGCSSGAGYHRVGVWHSDGTDGWANRPSGHTEPGCDGTYDAIPVSGDPGQGNGEYAYWSFSPGAAGATCELYVHVPDDESPLWIGDREAKYQIFSGSSPEGSPVAVFGIDQSQIRGGWVQATGFTSPTEEFTVQLTNVGENPLADQGTNAHVAASVVRAECS